MRNVQAKHQETTMKTSDSWKRLRGSAGAWLGWWVVVGLVWGWTGWGSSYTWSGPYAPDEWEGVGNDPSAYYVFTPQPGEANLLHIAGAAVSGPSVTTVRFREGLTVPDDNFRFDYSVSYGQASPGTVAATFEIRDSADQVKETVVLTSLGTSGRMGPFVLSAGDRVYFILDSELSGGKFSPAYLEIAPVPEPVELGLVAGLGLIGYGLWRLCRARSSGSPAF